MATQSQRWAGRFVLLPEIYRWTAGHDLRVEGVHFRRSHDVPTPVIPDHSVEGVPRRGLAVHEKRLDGR
jgi:hypothetical protein